MRQIASLMRCFRIDLFMLILVFVYLTAQAKAEDQNQDECGGQIIRTALQSLDPADPVGGSTNLCVSRSGVQVRTSVVGLKQGNAYTVWFVYIEQPALCEHPGICDSASDYVANDPVGVLGRMDSAVVARSGHVKFSGNIPGMRLSPGSQVQIILIGHGPASTNTLSRARQLLTPQDPGLGSALGAPIAGPAGVGKGISVFTAP
jgi:hypothetical protein